MSLFHYFFNAHCFLNSSTFQYYSILTNRERTVRFWPITRGRSDCDQSWEDGQSSAQCGDRFLQFAAVVVVQRGDGAQIDQLQSVHSAQKAEAVQGQLLTAAQIEPTQLVATGRARRTQHFQRQVGQLKSDNGKQTFLNVSNELSVVNVFFIGKIGKTQSHKFSNSHGTRPRQIMQNRINAHIIWLLCKLLPNVSWILGQRRLAQVPPMVNEHSLSPQDAKWYRKQMDNRNVSWSRFRIALL